MQQCQGEFILGMQEEFNIRKPRESLVVQWLDLEIPLQGALV